MSRKHPEKEPHWTDNHITHSYIAWDETGANYIGIYSTQEEAQQALIEYAKILNKETSK